MTANHDHTPDTFAVLFGYVSAGGTQDEFERWHAAEITAAEQRGAARGKIEGLREAAEELDGSVSVSDLRDDSIRDGIPWTLGACLAAHDAASPITDWLRNRADQMEGDDGDV